MNLFDKIYLIINKYFPNCEIIKHKKFDEDYLAIVITLIIKSNFGPLATASREWKMLGDLVKIIPPQEISHYRIYAEIHEPNRKECQHD